MIAFLTACIPGFSGACNLRSNDIASSAFSIGSRFAISLFLPDAHFHAILRAFSSEAE
jgi:hypothetical protein